METLWTALISAAATLVVALASASLTGRMAANRERERLRSEEQRERDRLEAQSRFDNAARLFEHRRVAIENVVSSFSRYRTAAEEEERGGYPQGEESASDMYEPAPPRLGKPQNAFTKRSWTRSSERSRTASSPTKHSATSRRPLKLTSAPNRDRRFAIFSPLPRG